MTSIAIALLLSLAPISLPYTGTATWYGKPFHGRQTASGEIYNMYGLTAAHMTLPLLTTVKVTNLKNNKSVTVRINDRGAFKPINIDLSWEAARQIDSLRDGVVPVLIEEAATTDDNNT